MRHSLPFATLHGAKPLNGVVINHGTCFGTNNIDVTCPTCAVICMHPEPGGTAFPILTYAVNIQYYVLTIISMVLYAEMNNHRKIGQFI